MNATTSLAHYPAGLPLTADQVTEFHAARLLLLLYLCGIKNRIQGLTKLAKLDFFVRYPDFFRRAGEHLAKDAYEPALAGVEAVMVRHHYGPWDTRYYQILPYLEGRELISVEKDDKAYVFTLTDQGVEIARRLAGEASYQDLCTHMKAVKKLLGNKSGDVLKRLVYQLFDEEIAKLPLGRVIQP